MMIKRTVNKKIKNGNITIGDITKENIDNLKETIIKEVDDPRQQHKKVYKIWDIIITVFLAVIANCNDWDDIVVFAESNYDFLRQYLKMTGGIPCAKTYERVISCIDSTQLESICLFFLTDIIGIKKKKMRDIINIDGKVDKSSSYLRIDDNGNIEIIKALNVLNAYSNQYGICLASEMIEDKTNEITAFPTIIERLNIRNKIITVDAINTQKENCTVVRKKRGDYVMAVKENQPNLYRDIVDYFDEGTLKELSQKSDNYIKFIETRGSETITYECYQTTDVDWYFEKKLWTGLKSIGVIKKTFDNPYYREKQVEYRYYISSLSLDINLFYNCVRYHWSVENKLHWHLDFTFKQDDNTTVDKEALLGLQIIKKMALGILNPIKEKKKISMNKLRLKISFNVSMKYPKFLNFMQDNSLNYYCILKKKMLIFPLI